MYGKDYYSQGERWLWVKHLFEVEEHPAASVVRDDLIVYDLHMNEKMAAQSIEFCFV